ncbi:MAG: acetyl esterase/lipase [Verrucomicrobiales bacterium]|jgi:acetyl esterase/lipase
MKALRLILTGFLASAAAGAAIAQEPEVKTGGMLYSKEPRRTLSIFYPDNWDAADKRPALVIFRCNIPEQREHFRKLGMVVIKPQTAPVNSGNLPKMTLEEIAAAAKPRDQVADTKSAIRFIRANAAKLGIDPEKIVATGTSGGGDLALQSHLNQAFEHEQDDESVSCSPDALLLYCPAFDGIDIWFVKSATLLEQTKTDAPAFSQHLENFANTESEYATPLNHRADLIKLAASLGKDEGIDAAEVERFQKILELFNNRDWQLLHPVADAMKMSASRILTEEPLPPTLMLFGTRDHLREPQEAFVEHARKLGQKFEVKIYEGGGHSFMTQPAFQEPSTRDVQTFLEERGFLPIN